ncbi:PX domain-containing protein [Yarrowia sp. C11]|nr:PX domain-containing protein [Yarrowia sp. C11]
MASSPSSSVASTKRPAISFRDMDVTNGSIGRKSNVWKVGRTYGVGDIDSLTQVTPIPVFTPIPVGPIRIVDNTNDEYSMVYGGEDYDTINENGRPEPRDEHVPQGVLPVWAADVNIPEYNIVAGDSKAGAYVSWTIVVETKYGGRIILRRRFSEIYDMREALKQEFPQHKMEIPQLPAKSMFQHFNKTFLQSRRRGLEYFFQCVFLNPLFASSKVLKEFAETK